ncbi:MULTISPECIES: GerAB/ArcD/ProY family transporter [Clostridium]|uniref:GerAB/ArcD/ProY family transporter n=1 Tax=Clostridium TaxID=1485 RepID=UPI00082508EA|nr:MULTISPECIES: endospore germination permease [Clostridium]PJI10088.1 spore gernimation protein [Clostridium sp. CT7]
MRIENGVISGSQLTFLIAGLLQASALTVTFVSGITKQNTWIVLTGGFIIALFLLQIYTALSKKFPGKNLIEINDVIYGSYFGKAISILYISYFGYIVAANFRFTADFLSAYLFNRTYTIVFIIIISMVSMYAIKKGIETIARAAFILSILAFIVSAIITISVIKDAHLSNFLPFFQMNFNDFIQGTNIMVSIPFGEMISFLMIFPYVNNIEKVKKSAFAGLIIGGTYFFIVVFRDTSVLGRLGYINALSPFETTRVINIGQIITRMEALISLMLLFNEFMKICIMYYSTVLSIAQFFKLQSYKPLVVPVGIIGAIFSIIMFDSPVEHMYFASNIYVILVIPIVVILPIISLIVASIRKLNQNALRDNT